MKTHKFLWVCATLLFLSLLIYFITGYIRSLYLESTLIKLQLPSINGATGTIRVVQVSDLHRAAYGEDNQDLIDLVASKSPDLIMATGDMIDMRTAGFSDCVSLFQRLRAIAPVLYSLGNHEIQRPDIRELQNALESVGVQVVNNSTVQVTVHGMTLRIGGLYRAEYLRDLISDGPIDILLCHFPDMIAFYAAYGVPLTFSGHTHGGQFRVPLLHIALYAPGQGLFPKYTSGLYEERGSYMIVSRGLGNSSFPFRIHNPPEIVVADITYSN